MSRQFSYDPSRVALFESATRKRVRPWVAIATFLFVLVTFLFLDRLHFVSFAAMFIIYEGVLLLGLPVAVALASRVPLTRAFRLRRPAHTGEAVLLLTASVIFILLYFFGLSHLARVAPATRHLVVNEAGWIHYSLSQMHVLPLLAGGLLVAFAEEAFFRGFMLGAVLRRFGFWGTIAVCGVSFAVVHLSAGKALPTLAAGIWLTYIGIRTGSVWVPMLAHFILNTTAFVAVMILGWPDGVVGFIDAPSSTITGSLLAALVAIVTGYEIWRRRRHSASTPVTP